MHNFYFKTLHSFSVHYFSQYIADASDILYKRIINLKKQNCILKGNSGKNKQLHSTRT